MNDNRIKKAVEQASTAFWAQIVKNFPEAVYGDLDPEVTVRLRREQEAAVKRWVQLNIPVYYHEVADKLAAKGFDAELEVTGGGITCVMVRIGRFQFWWGTANENWGADVWVDGDFWDGHSLEIANCASDSSDYYKVAELIARHSLVFEKQHRKDQVETGS